MGEEQCSPVLGEEVIYLIIPGDSILFLIVRVNQRGSTTTMVYRHELCLHFCLLVLPR